MNRYCLFYLLFPLFLFSCKKEKGALHDFDPGKFDFVCIWYNAGVKDTVMGEVTGPYLQRSAYVFRVKQEMETVPKLVNFQVGTSSGLTDAFFDANGIGVHDTKIIYEEHDPNNLAVYFQKANTIMGSLILTRKE